MLSAGEARLLDRFSLPLSDVAAASTSGPRDASARGRGLEFQDHRPYQAGDDPRTIDWAIDARLRQLVVRVYQSEAHARVHLLLDVSGSMRLGSPAKLACAARIAAALSYVAAARGDAVGLATFADAVRIRIAPATGRAQLFRVLDALSRIEADGVSAIGRVLTGYAGAVPRPGLAVVLSDFFDTGPVLDGLRALLYRGLVPAVIQIVSDEELDPVITEDVELVDVEQPDQPGILAGPAVLAAYRSRMEDHSAAVRALCVQSGSPWLRLPSSASFDEVVRACVGARLLAPLG